MENRVFDQFTNKVRMEKLRCIDMKVNGRVGFPLGRTPKEEAKIEVAGPDTHMLSRL